MNYSLTNHMHMYKQNLALNNLQGLIYHKVQPIFCHNSSLNHPICCLNQISTEEVYILVVLFYSYFKFKKEKFPVLSGTNTIDY